MADFVIYADSSSNISDELRISRDIRIVSYYCTVDGKELPCAEQGGNYSETAKEYYRKMRENADVKTSLIVESRFVEALTPALEQNQDVLLFTIASGISGTFNQAKEAAKALSAKYPDRTVIAVDSANASMGEGLLALKAADLRDMGESCSAAAEWLVENAYKLNAYLTVSDLKYLKKSGRISALTAIAGTLLSIKPIIKADGSELPKLAVCGREHGRKKAISAVLKAFVENVIDPESQTVAITHADCEEDAKALAEEVKKYGVQDIIIEYYDICTGSHAGPGTLALFFMGKDRRGDAVPAPKRIALGKKRTIQ